MSLCPCGVDNWCCWLLLGTLDCASNLFPALPPISTGYIILIFILRPYCAPKRLPSVSPALWCCYFRPVCQRLSAVMGGLYPVVSVGTGLDCPVSCCSNLLLWWSKACGWSRRARSFFARDIVEGTRLLGKPFFATLLGGITVGRSGPGVSGVLSCGKDLPQSVQQRKKQEPTCLKR